ncbi:hypothetical protein [Palleronia sp. THAF1]|uniref:hypothetical protein n=1 Tax=Palleronia sp. THAF1 TaxID=2587842 RepID=UPI00156275B9|nr:hypothetical protein [Palleronia sp. THAF1]
MGEEQLKEIAIAHIAARRKSIAIEEWRTFAWLAFFPVLSLFIIGSGLVWATKGFGVK